MKAAVILAQGESPVYADFAEPVVTEGRSRRLPKHWPVSRRASSWTSCGGRWPRTRSVP